MKALELLKSGESLLLVDAIESKKMQNTAETLNGLLRNMNDQINSFASFSASQLDGEYNDKIVVAKSLARFFEGNKALKVENSVLSFEAEEKAHINDYYQTKTKLLDTIHTLIKDSGKEAIVSNYDIYEGEFVRCEAGHEIIILNGRNIGVLETLFEELDRDLIVNGNFSQIEPQEVDYSLAVLNRNIELCERKNNEIWGTKAGKLNKIASIIEKLKEIGERVVAFYSYKTSLELIGCNPKGIKDYENELSRTYVPLKKTLQKELKIELEDICEVSINEEEYDSIPVEEETQFQPSKITPQKNNYPQFETTTQLDTVQDTTPSAVPETPIESAPVSTGNPFETTEPQSPFEQTNQNSNPFENASEPSPIENTSNTTNPFGNISSTTSLFESTGNEPSPFENTSNSTSPFESAPQGSPFENDNLPKPFESINSTSPFEDTTKTSEFTSPFENLNNASPFEATRPNPFENSNTSNPFEDQ